MQPVANRVHVNVGTIGHVDHGKTTLTAAITGYQPRFYFGTTDLTGVIDVGEGGSVTHGDRASIRFRLQKAVGVEEGMRFAIREGGKTIGAAIV